jgi:hypothetical protein
MENSPTFCELDYKITSSEIMKAISKLKSGKAVGLDGCVALFRQPITPTAHFSDNPLLRQPITPTAHFSDNAK